MKTNNKITNKDFDTFYHNGHSHMEDGLDSHYRRGYFQGYFRAYEDAKYFKNRDKIHNFIFTKLAKWRFAKNRNKVVEPPFLQIKDFKE